MSDPLTTTEGLKVGDVVQYSIKLVKHNDPYWFTRFAVVVAPPVLRHYLKVLTLVMQPDPKYEPRRLHLGNPDTVVTFLPEDKWPQGVVAVRMKHLHTGLLKLDDT